MFSGDHYDSLFTRFHKATDLIEYKELSNIDSNGIVSAHIRRVERYYFFAIEYPTSYTDETMKYFLEYLKDSKFNEAI